MDKINFTKFHGFGNDYIVVEKDNLPEGNDINGFTVAICDRHRGAGSDGIALIAKEDGVSADFSCRIINPDGSEAGFSGNGTRCAVSYLYYSEKWMKNSLRLKTISGIKVYDFLKREADTFWFRAELGKPSNFEVMGTFVGGIEFKYPVISLNVGNPVCAIFVDDFEAQNWRLIGETLESMTKLFPERTNVVFIRVVDLTNIEIRIWERGAGETYSSGTCSIAAAIASAFTERTERDVLVHAIGGTTEASWRNDDEMLITGRADYSYFGVWKV